VSLEGKRLLPITAAIWLAGYGLALSAATLSPLYQRGYVAIPEPQKVTLGDSDFRFDAGWRVEVGPGVSANDAAVEALREDLESRFRLRLDGAKAGVVRLSVSANSVAVRPAQDSNKAALAEQAYRIDLAAGDIRLTGNTPTGLFYAVETLVELIKPMSGDLWLPEGHIEDWPDLELRCIYWDDAHHLEKPEALKRAIRQAAFYKINGFALKLEGHFQFKSAPTLVEPYALTPAEYQDLTDYGLKYHVQLIPYLDAPAHIAFILKHAEYAPLREYPDSNYEMCATNPASIKLINEMLQDLMDANRGGKYIVLSTDEPYYVGLANNAQCKEAARAQELGSVGKVFAEFVTKTANSLHDQGRIVIFWGEYPMKPEDLASLPKHLVNGETYGPDFDREFRRLGMREMIYTSTEGEEKLFPSYFVLPQSKRLRPAAGDSARVGDTFRKISFDTSRRDANLMGELNAGWADMGLHPETFWLGYATSASSGWRPGSPDPRESMSSFYTLFYGWTAVNMDRLYQLMSTQAQYWQDSWDTTESTARKGIWGYSAGIFNPRRPARDQTIPLPPAPGAGLKYQSDWAQSNAQRMAFVDDATGTNDELIGLLYENLKRVQWNRYNLEVMISIAQIYRQNLDMLRSIAQIDSTLKRASDAAERNQPKPAIQAMDLALSTMRLIQLARNRALRDAQEVWYKTWFPRVAEANGRKFLHELDDVKDHLPDRTTDMRYLVYRELLLPLDEWFARIQTVRNDYAAAHQVRTVNQKFDWKDLKPVAASELSEIPLE
jgi:hypothetical protein